MPLGGRDVQDQWNIYSSNFTQTLWIQSRPFDDSLSTGSASQTLQNCRFTNSSRQLQAPTRTVGCSYIFQLRTHNSTMKYNYGAFHSIESQNFPCTNTSKSPNYIFSRDCSRQLQCPLYRDCCLLAVDNSSLSGRVKDWGNTLWLKYRKL